MHRILFFTLVILLSLPGLAQFKPKVGQGLYNTGKHTVEKGWYFGMGLSFMAPYLKVTDTQSADSLSNNYRQDYTAKPTGKLGFCAEIGKFKMNPKKRINYVDYGLMYKWLRGGEKFTQERFVNGSSVSSQTTKASFSDHVISAHLNLGYRYNRDEKTFFVNGLGLNADYFFATSRKDGLSLPNSSTNFVGPFNAEIHYFFGVGIKTNSRVVVFPTIETPIFGIYPFNHIKATHDHFNTRSRPILLKVKFLILEKDSKSCPKVFNPMGMDPNNNLSK